jgi:hypothetical protein
VAGNNNGSAGGRGRYTVNMAMGELAFGALSTDNKGTTFPDVVGALRIDQAWGYAQVAAALHDASGGYYGGANSDLNGHPSDKLGFAVTGGFTLNDVFGLKGDQVGMQAAYSKGAAGYVTRVNAPMMIWGSNSSVGAGWITDGVYDNFGANSAVELTAVWGANGFYQHFWNPKWRTSLYGGYVQVNYDSAAINLINQHLPTPVGSGIACGMPVEGAVAPPLGVGNSPGNSCSPNFSWWQVGTRTQWNPHPDLDIGVDVLWTHLNTAYKGPAQALSGSGARPGCASPGATSGCSVDDQDVLSVMFRVQRNFLP